MSNIWFSSDLHFNHRQSIGKCLAGSSRYSTVGGRIWKRVGE